MDPADRVEFSPVTAQGSHLYCYRDKFYIARIAIHADHCAIDGAGFAPCHVRNEEEAREVVRVWARMR